MGTAIHIPAYCQTCHSIFPSGVCVGAGTKITMKDNRAGPCPNGHMGMIMDGTFDIADGAMRILSSGRVTQEVLARLRKLAENTKSGIITPEKALIEAVDILPSEAAAIVKKLGANNPLAALLILIFILTSLSTVGNNVTSAFKAARPSEPAPPAIVNNNITVQNHIASGDRSGDAVDKPVSRQQLRRLEQMRKKHENRTKPSKTKSREKRSPMS
ncbi:hypothetical protein EDE12_106131 [Methylosinus sp. sav-2]|uniref:hypothetical protein n=1 Tax=Methylosinus sp. sav-2 TaxID=2485168 RepID=UPI0010657002|nr:hypothetical protein [Methylosinus sp. sav-2]TDX63986.1 hypothetical protein EDE12_106131 [Methylosinus sp. sav-2]